MTRTLAIQRLGGPPQGPTRRGPGPGCPRCGQRNIWESWVDTVASCPTCGLDLERHGSLAGMWLQTWVTIVLVVGWIVAGLVVTGDDGAGWVTGGAILLAVMTPPLTYRYSKGAMLRTLYQLDPPSRDHRHE